MATSPSEYTRVSPCDLLAEVARGHAVFDHRLLHALLDEPARTLDGIVRFANSAHQSRVDIAPDLVRIFTFLPTPEALPFLIQQIRLASGEIADELVDAIVRIGSPAIDPLLALCGEMPEASSEIAFVLAALGVQDERIHRLILDIQTSDPEEGEFLLEVYHPLSPEAPPPYDIWADYPRTADPDVFELPPAEREEFLQSDSPGLRALAVECWIGGELSAPTIERVMSLAQTDPDEEVRGLAWEALREHSAEDRIHGPMLQRLEDPATGPLERAHLACALSPYADEQPVLQAIEQAYQNPATRAKALEAMWRSLHPSFEKYIFPHLEDADLRIRQHAITGAGYFRMRGHLAILARHFRHPVLRPYALFSYALAAPFDPALGGVSGLEKKIADLAEGLSEDDEEWVRAALDLRKPVSDDVLEPTRSEKVGRNDPCPCGSGKKYKKCCGA